MEKTTILININNFTKKQNLKFNSFFYIKKVKERTSIHMVYNSGVKCHFLYRMILFVVFRSKSKTSCYVYNIVTGLLYLSFKQIIISTYTYLNVKLNQFQFREIWLSYYTQ
jgi:hypothetical protein